MEGAAADTCRGRVLGSRAEEAEKASSQKSQSPLTRHAWLGHCNHSFLPGQWLSQGFKWPHRNPQTRYSTMSSSQTSDHKSPAEPSQLLLCACEELGPFAEIVALNCMVGMGDSVNMSEKGTEAPCWWNQAEPQILYTQNPWGISALTIPGWTPCPTVLFIPYTSAE